MPYSARGHTMSCGVDEDLKTSIEAQFFSRVVATPIKDVHVTSWAACLDSQLTLDYHDGGILTQSMINLLRNERDRTHKQLLAALSQELFHIAKRARRTWRHSSQKEMQELAKEFALPKPSIGSLVPVDQILEQDFKF